MRQASIRLAIVFSFVRAIHIVQNIALSFKLISSLRLMLIKHIFF